MSERYINVCHDCASSADMDHLFFTMRWAKKICETCGKRVPCVLLDAIVKGKILKALHDKEEPPSEETEEKNV